MSTAIIIGVGAGGCMVVGLVLGIWNERVRGGQVSDRYKAGFLEANARLGKARGSLLQIAEDARLAEKEAGAE